MIQSKDSKYILQEREITLAYSGAAFPSKNSSIPIGALLFLDNFDALKFSIFNVVSSM